MHPAAARPLVMQLRNSPAQPTPATCVIPLRGASHTHYARDHRREMVTSKSSRWTASPVPEDHPRMDY